MCAPRLGDAGGCTAKIPAVHDHAKPAVVRRFCYRDRHSVPSPASQLHGAPPFYAVSAYPPSVMMAAARSIPSPSLPEV